MTTFVITAGHNNSDPGAIQNGRKETEITVFMRNTVAAKLRERGHIVYTDGQGAENQSLSAAIALIRRGTVAVEFHANSFTNPTASGVETVSQLRHKALSQKLSAAIAKVLGTRVRGDNGWIDDTKTARGTNGFVRGGGVLVELFFLSNKAELDAYDQKKWLVASAIADVLDRES